mgnify:CR=1 FL=1
MHCAMHCVMHCAMHFVMHYVMQSVMRYVMHLRRVRLGARLGELRLQPSDLLASALVGRLALQLRL